MEKLIKPVGPARPKRCVPHTVTWNWFFNRGPRGRSRP